MSASWGSSTIGSDATPAFPSSLVTDDILLAVASIEAAGTVNNPDAAVWTLIGNDSETGPLVAYFFWARKTAANLLSAPTWTASAGTVIVSYARITGATASGTPYNISSGVGFLITKGTDATAELGSISPGVANTFILAMQVVLNWANSTSTDLTERADAAAAGPHWLGDDGVLASGSTGVQVINNGGTWIALLIAITGDPPDPSLRVNADAKRQRRGSGRPYPWIPGNVR